MLGLIFACGLWSANAADGDAELEQRVDELKQLEHDLDAIAGSLSEQAERRESLQRELEQSERHIAELARSERELDALVAEQRALTERLGVELANEREALAAARSSLAEILRAAHAMGRGDQLRMLLNQEDAERVARLVGYYGYFSRARAKHMEQVRLKTELVERKTAEAEQETAQLAELAARQVQTRRELESGRIERLALIGTLETSMANDQARISELNAHRHGLKRVIEHLEQQGQIAAEAEIAVHSLQSLKGHIPWPLKPVRVVKRFGGGAHGADIHRDGVLLRAAAGAEVHAIHNGRVVYADWLRGFGLLLVIDHGDNYMTFYGHNETLLKEVGEWVGDEEPIALAGNSGGQARNALYFALRRGGEPLDPTKWCGH